MHPLVRRFGKLLRLVGISSPEDLKAQVKAAGDPSSRSMVAEKAPKSKDDAVGS